MHFRSVALLALTLCAPSVFAQWPGALPVTSNYSAGYNAIQPNLCKKWLTFLSSKECEGRGSGQPGFQKAADFMAARFKEFGLKPIGVNGTYFQPVPFAHWRDEPKNSGLELVGKRVKFDFTKDLSVSNTTTEFDVTAPIAFIRSNGKDAELPDDKAVKGKMLIVFAKDLGKLRTQLALSDAAGILYVTEGMKPAPWASRRGAPPSVSDGKDTQFFGKISPNAAKKLAKEAGIARDAIDPAKADTNTAALTESTQTAHLKTKVEVGKVDVPNVVGVIEGSDLKDEVVGIGAHLDHLGMRDGVIYPGADDDGSGSTALLAIARAFHENHSKPRRTILFMAFCGEELGLIGSGFYSDNPILPLDKMNCELQMDMVARNSYGAQNGDTNRMDIEKDNIDTIRLVGSKRISTELDELIQKENEFVKFRFKYDAEDVYTRSDHYNFAKHGVPIAFMFDGFTPDYHQPSDTIEKINFDKLANAAKLYFLVASEAADKTERLKHDVK